MSTWESVGGPPGGAKCGVGACLNKLGGNVIFTVGENGKIWHSWQNSASGAWQPWKDLGHGGYAAQAMGLDGPGAALYQDGRINVFYRGIDSVIYTLWQTAPNDHWHHEWVPIGSPPGGARSGVAATLNKLGGLVVFTVGNDGALWHTWQNSANGAWQPWKSIGGSFTNVPGATLYHDGRLGVFAVGAHGAVMHRWQTMPNDHWNDGWTPLGTPPGNMTTSGVTATLNKPGGFIFFTHAPGKEVWYRWQNQINGNWQPWTSMGGDSHDTPGATLYGDGRLNVFARWADGSVRTRWQTTPNGNWHE